MILLDLKFQGEVKRSIIDVVIDVQSWNIWDLSVISDWLHGKTLPWDSGYIKVSHPQFFFTSVDVTDQALLNSIQQNLYGTIAITVLVHYSCIWWWILTVDITMNQTQVNSITCSYCNETYHYNPISEPFTTSIIWGFWGFQMAGDSWHPQMAVSEPRCV